MSKSIHNMIKRIYEKRQKSAFDNLMDRKNEVYSKIPRLQEIESQIQLSGVRYNKMILLGEGSAEKVMAQLLTEMNELKHEKERLLEASGYPKNCLELIYECSLCKDTGISEGGNGNERCSCYKQLLINELYNHANLSLTRVENFTAFNESYYPNEVDVGKYGIKISPRENVLRIKDRCLRFIENFSLSEEKNLFFSGPTGVGKTFMTNCIAAELLNKGITVLYQTSPLLFNIINEFKMKSHKDEDFQDSNYRNIFEVELLIIDDLGTESMSAARYAELLTILNTRQANNLTRPCKTIISTNIDVKDLYEYYTERVASRIIGCFDMFKFAGDDLRRVKKINTR